MAGNGDGQLLEDGREMFDATTKRCGGFVSGDPVNGETALHYFEVWGLKGALERVDDLGIRGGGKERLQFLADFKS